MTEKENQLNYAALENYQEVSIPLEKYITAYVNNWKCLYLVVEKVIKICHLPSVGDMATPRPMKYILNKLEEII
jgi:hypothetical protein